MTAPPLMGRGQRDAGPLSRRIQQNPRPFPQIPRIIDQQHKGAASIRRNLSQPFKRQLQRVQLAAVGLTVDEHFQATPRP